MLEGVVDNIEAHIQLSEHNVLFSIQPAPNIRLFQHRLDRTVRGPWIQCPSPKLTAFGIPKVGRYLIASDSSREKANIRIKKADTSPPHA